MAEFSKYIGLDVHKETIAGAVADGVGGEDSGHSALRQPSGPAILSVPIRQKSKSRELICNFDSSACS